jgi:hypothetical protein
MRRHRYRGGKKGGGLDDGSVSVDYAGFTRDENGARCRRVVGGERHSYAAIGSRARNSMDRPLQRSSSWSCNNHEDGGPTIQLPAAGAAAPFRL